MTERIQKRDLTVNSNFLNCDFTNEEMKMKKRLFLLLFLIFLTNAAKAQDENDDTPVKIDTVLLTMPLVVKDKNGHNVAGLKRKIFQSSKIRKTRHRVFFQ